MVVDVFSKMFNISKIISVSAVVFIFMLCGCGGNAIKEKQLKVAGVYKTEYYEDGTMKSEFYKRYTKSGKNYIAVAVEYNEDGTMKSESRLFLKPSNFDSLRNVSTQEFLKSVRKQSDKLDI